MPYPTIPKLKFSRDANMWLGTFITNITPASDALVLVANTAQNYTIPDGANKLLFSCGDEYWVDANKAAVIPAGTIKDGSAPLRSPAALGTHGYTYLSFISPRACTVQISVYA